MGGVELGGVGRGEEGQPHPRQRPQRLELPLISQGRVCEGASVGQALQILTGRREAVLGWVPELWARESCSAKGGETESLGPSGRLKGAYHRTPLSPKWAAAGGGLLRDSASLRLRPQPSVPGLFEYRREWQWEERLFLFCVPWLFQSGMKRKLRSGVSLGITEQGSTACTRIQSPVPSLAPCSPFPDSTLQQLREQGSGSRSAAFGAVGP